MSDARELRKYPVRQHLNELRNRLLIAAASVLAATLVCFALRDQILSLLARPFDNPLYYTSPTGGLELAIGISLGAGVVVAFPVIVYECLAFLVPLLPVKAKCYITGYLIASWCLLLSGISFAYYVSLPAALSLLSAFSSQQIKALISADQYLTFIAAYLGGFGILFQLPVILLLLDAIVPLAPKKLMSYLPYVILVSFIAAAILTPTPDPINQTIMALVPITLYILTVGIIFLKSRRRRK